MSEINVVIEPLMSKQPIEVRMTVPGPPGDPTLLIDDAAAALDKTYSSTKQEELLGGKVDKVEGKGLSTEDYTTVEKAKIENVPDDTNAQLADVANGLSQHKIDYASLKDVNDNAVTPYMISLLKKPNNMFNVLDTTSGYTISSSTGQLTPNVNFKVSDYIPVKPNQTYITKDIGRYALYGESLNFISSATSTTFTTPPTACYVRLVSGLLNVTGQMNEGSILLPYDSYEFQFEDTDKYPFNIKPSALSIDSSYQFAQDVITPNAINFMVESSNLFNKNTVAIDKNFDSWGVEIVEVGRCVSDFIPVKANQIYSKNTELTVRVAYFNKRRKFISYISANSGITNFTTPPNACFIKIAVYTTNLDIIQINEGSDLLVYEPYKFTLKSTLSYPIEIDSTLIPIGIGGDVLVGGDLGEQFIYDDSANYAIAEEKILANSLNKSVVDIIEFSTNSLDAELKIYYKTNDLQEVLYDLVPNDGTTSIPCTMANLQLHGSAIIEFIDFDDRNNVYKVSIKNLIFANGFKVSMKNNSTTTAITIACRVVSRQYA